MPQHKSPQKRMGTDKKRAARNNYVKRTIRTLTKELQVNPENRMEQLDKLYAQLDKAAKKGVIHKRTASRRKARLAAFVNKANKQEN
ncbi:MAG: 30S ribosomal protein S20 [Candidatus Cloacimonetes bacterium]|jgi:small subunit ribosomal protein S20|nr:30S ribosomal protein S20 [Candidatus Cloacimonadota bacterium]MDY0299530.1 30S ribosomal protein S20 [Candidatus Cloacimonadaceae bacterium]MCB5278811.1 30S ribosomal protein S20 [Candidatus Cloacimonadota bacterium]MCK9332660.1 30S ribosomal protein S20 [Candidatus Cloacimonadota bacterium]MDD2210204.1 30S ribosomal protein S20 [Candidatus Cloacimonadota bacterium]